jgi:hypothetical protein
MKYMNTSITLYVYVLVLFLFLQKDSHVPSPDAYDRKKTFAEGLLDVAILIANATQLKAVVSNGPSNKYYIPLLVLISLLYIHSI